MAGNARAMGKSHDTITEEAMPAQVSDELRDFHQFLSAKLRDSHIDWSPEEAVDEWRRLHPDSQAAAEDIAAIHEALTDMVNGDQGIPFEEFDRNFRKQHNLPEKS
jgi:hypothetical protein